MLNTYAEEAQDSLCILSLKKKYILFIFLKDIKGNMEKKI